VDCKGCCPPRRRKTTTSEPTGALDALRALHAEIDREAARIARLHGERLTCRRGCADCCRDDLTVFEVEAERIRRERPQVLEEAPAARGQCAFLDPQGACRVYDARPHVCRTQGLPLCWFDEDEEGEIERHLAICELNAEGPPLEELPEDACWLIGPTELALQRLQGGFGSGGQARVALRDLFRR